MRFVYLSPHLDDAALSAGGFIREQTWAGTPVEIWTVMSGYPETADLSDFAKEMHAEWGTTTAAETVRIRRNEDRQAAAAVGARAVHLNFVDCIYRRGPGGAFLYGEPVNAAVHPDDERLPDQIAKVIDAQLPSEAALICQLSIGGHVDHVLVRRAAERLGRPLLYVADIPYLLDHPEDLAPRTEGLASSVRFVSDAGFAAWLAAIEQYSSQLGSLFDSLESLRERLRLYWAQAGGIRLWSRTSASAALGASERAPQKWPARRPPGDRS